MKKLYCLFLITLFACNKAQPPTVYEGKVSIFTEVSVIDIRSGNIQDEKYVVVENGKIKDIFDKKPELPETAEVIDGKGKYLMPGLAEMHAHIPSPDWGRENMEETLFLYLSNGITTIRGMLGHPVHLELRERALKNEVLSPRVITSSPSLNGNTVKTKEEAIEKVKAYKEAGYDFLKLHPGIKLEVFDQIVETANEVGINFAGHVSIDVGIRHALKSGYASVDHVDGYLEGLVPKEKGLNPNSNGFFGYNFTYDADTSLIDELVALSKENKVWVVPTQTLFERWFSPDDPQVLASATEMKYMPKAMLENWVKSKENLINDPSFNKEQWSAFNQIRRELIYKLHHEGHGLLLGSDAPQVFNVPGFSIHHELATMIKAGLTPLEALQIGTINPAKFLQMEGQFGEIINGASADLILLNNSPINNLEALKEISGVMVRGQWLSKEEIDQRLEEIAKNSAQ